MNAQIDVPNSGSSEAATLARNDLPQPETAPAADSRICWVEVKQYPYQPDHQVELLHLQAEADALLLQLQAMSQKRLMIQSAGESR
ncbi:MAG TPA: hypothetical protein V6D06_06280 [Trichocoleus sp.]